MSYITSVTLFTAGIIGVDAILKSFTNLSSSMSNVKSLVSNIKKYKNNKEICELISNLDIHNQLDNLNLLLVDIKDTNKITHSTSINHSIQGLYEIMINIETELNLIYEEIQYNKNLWFLKSLRSYSFNKRIKKLVLYCNVLQQRKSDLLETIKINQYLTPENIDNNNDKSDNNNNNNNKCDDFVII